MAQLKLVKKHVRQGKDITGLKYGYPAGRGIGKKECTYISRSSIV
jgi:hypothetical protein